MKPALEYYICAENGLGKLQESVNKKIAEGFKPQGGVAVIRYTASEDEHSIKHDWMWSQAMTKRQQGRF